MKKAKEELCLEDKTLALYERLLKICETSIERLEQKLEEEDENGQPKSIVMNDLMSINVALSQVAKNIQKYSEFE